jgi:DNA mismatch repair protein MutS2
LQNLTRELEDARRELEEEKAHHAQLSQSLETDRANLRLEQLKFRQTVLAEKQKIVLDARKRVEQMIARLPSRKEIALARKQLKEENRRTQEESTQVQKDIDRLTGVPGRDLALDELHVGLDVWARNLRQAGTIRAVYPGKRKVDIAVQGLVFNVDIDDLAECPPKESEAPVPSGKTTVPHKELLSTELNLIGQRVEEAIGLLDRFLNDVSFSNVDQIRIIHGRGTGALRRGVREFLRSHPLVEGFHAEDEEEGEKGAVTVVRLK